MKAHDFQFDNKKLSGFGFIMCYFGDKGLDTVSNGAQVTFNTVPTLNGAKHELTSSQYDDCLETTIQICKTPCYGNNLEISSTEFRGLVKWLCRKKFLKLKFLDKEHMDLYYEAKIDVARIEMDGKLYGLELTITTNRPFALRDAKTISINNTTVNGKYSINDISHEEGYIYPHTEITLNADGDLNIYNAMEDRTTLITSCVAGEVITMDYPVIQSSISSHNIQNNFNWNFFRIANTYENSRNDLTISLPCSIKIEYSPIVKVGL